MATSDQSSQTIPRVRTRRGGDVTATRILDAAEELFAERGYAGTTLRDVAGRVGVRNPSIYNHFAGKEALYQAVLERVVGPVLESLSELVEAGPDADRGQVITRTMEVLGQHPNFPRLLLQESLAGGEQLTGLLGEWLTPLFTRSDELVRRTSAAEMWTHEDLPLLILAMYQIVVGYFTVAPLYERLVGVDLLAEDMRHRQHQLLRRLADLLFPLPAARSPLPGDGSFKGES